MGTKPKVRQCQRFFCRRDGKPRCCADCPSPCGNPCLNHPDKCGLVETAESGKQGRRVPFDGEYALELWKKGLTDAEIGEALGVHKRTIFNWRKRTGLGPSKKGEK